MILECLFLYPLLDGETPDHDLQPPRFSRTALEQMLDDWAAVKAMVMSGVADGNGDEQSGTALLDKFTYRILVKCGNEVSFSFKISMIRVVKLLQDDIIIYKFFQMLDILLTTLIREIQSKVANRREEAEMVARRFIRSVARIFVVISVEMAPALKKGITPTHVESCRKVFLALITYAIEELCEIANSQIAPVRLGVVRPTAPFPLLNTTSESASTRVSSLILYLKIRFSFLFFFKFFHQLPLALVYNNSGLT